MKRVLVVGVLLVVIAASGTEVPAGFQKGMTWGFAARLGFFASEEARKDDGSGRLVRALRGSEGRAAPVLWRNRTVRASHGRAEQAFVAEMYTAGDYSSRKCA